MQNHDKQTLADLRAGFALLDEGKAWSQGRYYTQCNEEHTKLLPHPRRCSSGALFSVTDSNPFVVTQRLRDAGEELQKTAICQKYGGSIPKANDNEDWPAVQAMWMEAIRNVKQRIYQSA